jgi:hypothetical protein
MRPTFVLMLSLVLPSAAGNFNVVHLAEKQDLVIEILCDQRNQAITLQPGGDSGTFTLPEKKAEFRIRDQSIEPCKVAADRAGRLIMIYRKSDKLLWHTVTSKAEKNKTSLRLINLTTQDVSLSMKDKTIELAAGKDHDAGVFDSLNLSVSLNGQKKQSVKVEEPTAWVGIIYPTDAGPKLQFVADR